MSSCGSGYGGLEWALDGICSEDATATEAADLAALKEHVSNLPGGFATLDETVRDHLRLWFEGQGAVLTGSRVQAVRRSIARQGSSSTSVFRRSSHSSVMRQSSCLSSWAGSGDGLGFVYEDDDDMLVVELGGAPAPVELTQVASTVSQCDA